VRRATINLPSLKRGGLALHDVADDLHDPLALVIDLRNTGRGNECGAGAMRKPDAGFDFDRYRKLLAEAVDEQKRLALINLLVDEKAKDSLAAQSRLGMIRSVLSAPPKPSVDE
jgi:hypothetical protein